MGDAWPLRRVRVICGGTALRITIVGINYEPELAGIAPYTTGVAKDWASQGHDVTVITGVPHYPQWRRLPFAKSDREDNPLVLRYNHFIPRRPRALGRVLYEATWLVGAARSLFSVKSDVVVGVVPSLSGAVLAWLLVLKRGVPFGIIFQDLMGSAALQSGYAGGWRLAWLAARIELAIARQAAGVAVVAEGFRPYLEAGGVEPARILRVRNWAATAAAPIQAADLRKRLGWAPDEFICLHAGNMGQKQALDNILEAARLLRGNRVKLVLAGDGNDRARLERLATSADLSNVQFLGVQPIGMYESMLRAADVLLLNQRPSVSHMALPSKLSSYLAAGKPVIAAVADHSEAAEEVAAAGGVRVPPDDPVSLAKAILNLVNDPNFAISCGVQAMEYAQLQLREEVTQRAYTYFLGSLMSLSTSRGNTFAGEQAGASQERRAERVAHLRRFDEH